MPSQDPLAGSIELFQGSRTAYLAQQAADQSNATPNQQDVLPPLGQLFAPPSFNQELAVVPAAAFAGQGAVAPYSSHGGGGGGGSSSSSSRRRHHHNNMIGRAAAADAGFYYQRDRKSGGLDELMVFDRPREDKDVTMLRIYRKMMRDKYKSAEKFERYKNKRRRMKYEHKREKREAKRLAKFGPDPMELLGRLCEGEGTSCSPE